MMCAFRLVRVAIVCALVIASAMAGARATTTAGTHIANTVTASFKDAQGTQYEAASNTLVVVVGAVSAVAVSPTQTTCNPSTDAVPVNVNATRTFLVTNDSNTPDAYALTVAVSGGGIVSVVTNDGTTQTAVRNGGTAPSLAPTKSLSVVVTFTTTGVAVGSSDIITLTARSTVANAGNGNAFATGSACAIPLGATKLVGPTGLAIAKLVDGTDFEQRPPGANVTYTIDFTNVGGIPAHNAVLTDPIPANVTAHPTSVAINGNPVVGVTYAKNVLTIPIGEIAVGMHDVISFTAVTNANMQIGSAFTNVATIAASNVTPQQTSAATVFVGVANVVYDGYNGASMPVADAVVTLVDDATGTLVLAPKAQRRAAATGRARADAATQAVPASSTTGAPGVYGFPLPDGLAIPRPYDILITAHGYLKRRIGVMLSQDADVPTLYDAVLTAKDGQYLATPGGFALVRGPVRINDVSDLLGNLPLFRPQSVALTKTVDKQTAAAGDRLSYTLTVGGVGVALTNVNLVDTLPRGVTYLPGSARANGVPSEPVRAGNTLTFSFPRLAAPIAVVYGVTIAPSVPSQTSLVNTVTVDALTPNGLRATNLAVASATTLVTGGTFSDRTVLTGRVYVDVRGSGGFDRGDPGVDGVRIFLEDGESVVTDREGRYSFPGVRPGMHVMRLDVASLPSTVRAFPDRAYDAERSPMRLVHGIFDGGVMDDINFAVEPL